MSNIIERIDALEEEIPMGLISYEDLDKLCGAGLMTTSDGGSIPWQQIQPASIDVTLARTIKLECSCSVDNPIIDIMKKESPNFTTKVMDDGHIMNPNDFILASTREIFNLPDWIAAEYRLNSSLGRVGLQHMLAAFADPGFNDATLTLELHNTLSQHDLLIREGMKIGQMIFHRVKRVPKERSYASIGQYNGQKLVQESLGLRKST
ncbi:deoxycytidine triphosphate deaminase [Vibrio phage 150E35-1]|nr:deoxycytidine triphosphate deaminase [Vibrio phage 150E35-1]